MKNGLRAFSTFVSDLNDRIRSHDAQGLAHWAVDDLSETLGFDCAWYGWARVVPEGVEIHASSSLNLPDHFLKTWQPMASEDLLAAGIIETPGRTAVYDRKQDHQTEGMVTLADTFGLKRMATAMHSRPGRIASFYLSSYRAGATARPWSDEERVFLQCAIEQLSSAMKLSTSEQDRKVANGTLSLIVTGNGIGVLGLESLRAQLDEIWPDWQGDRLPLQLRSLIGSHGEHILPDRGLIVTCEPAYGPGTMGLCKLTLRRMTRLNLLTPREREVAQTLACGKSHKEAARLLGVSPATIRNQTQAVYRKLEVDNRASLAALLLVPATPPGVPGGPPA